MGDIAFNGIISITPNLNPHRFSNLKGLFNDSFVFANLETPVYSNEKNESKNYHLYSTQEVAEHLLRFFNIGCVSLANNHIFDCKMSGLKATIYLLEELGIHHTGAGWKKEHIEPVVVEKDGVSIGFIAYVDKSTNPKTENYSELLINYFDVEKVIDDIKNLRNTVNKIICSVHWGNDYSFYPTIDQKNIAHKLIDAGADIIMGHHPHTLQPYERYKNGVIFYSLGGLTFGDFERNGKMYALYRKTKRGVIAKCNLASMELSFTATKEFVGNYVKVDTRNYHKWSANKWRVFKLKESSSFFKLLINFEENVLHRTYEYFFGYYQNPIKRLFQISNLGKFKKLFKSFKK